MAMSVPQPQIFSPSRGSLKVNNIHELLSTYVESDATTGLDHTTLILSFKNITGNPYFYHMFTEPLITFV